MKNFFYHFYIFFIGFEFLAVVIIVSLFARFFNVVEDAVSSNNINTDFLKFVAMLPFGLFVWIVKESKDIISSEKENMKYLVNWPDYWKFKATINVGLFYAALFLFCCGSAFFFKNGFDSAFGLMLFTCSLVGTSIVASHIYFASVSLKEIFNQD